MKKRPHSVFDLNTIKKDWNSDWLSLSSLFSNCLFLALDTVEYRKLIASIDFGEIVFRLTVAIRFKIFTARFT